MTYYLTIMIDQILSNAEMNCNAAKKINLNDTQYALTKFQKLADMITYELNFESNCKNFCNMVNNQLSNSYEAIEAICSFAKSQLTQIDFDKLQIDEKTEKGNDEIDIEKELNTFVTDFNELRKLSANATELQSMINVLPEYQKIVNKAFLEQENDKVKRVSQQLKIKKIRATDFLYEMQEFCAGLINIDKKNS